MDNKIAKTSSTIKIINVAGRTDLYNSFYLNEQFADVDFVFSADGVTVKIPAHRTLLAASSKKFKAMFATKKEDTHDTKKQVSITDASIVGYKRLLQFIYFDKVAIPISEIAEVLSLLEQYGMSEWLRVCELSLIEQLQLDDICIGLDVALTLGLHCLKEHCARTISNATIQVLSSESFLRCSKNALKFILEIDNISCKTELFDACLNWAKNACDKKGADSKNIENLRIALAGCVQSIPFAAMKAHQITECIIKGLGFFTSEELKELYSIRIPGRSLLKLFRDNESNIIKWSNDTVLAIPICNSLNSGPKRAYRETSIRVEKLCFTFNQHILLGALSTVKTRIYHGFTIDATMTITEIKLTESHGEVKQILLKQQVYFSTTADKFGRYNYISFNEAVLVKRSSKYEICFEVIDGRRNLFCNHPGYVASKSIGDNILVSLNCEGGGLVSHLYVNTVVDLTQSISPCGVIP